MKTLQGEPLLGFSPLQEEEKAPKRVRCPHCGIELISFNDVDTDRAGKLHCIHCTGLLEDLDLEEAVDWGQEEDQEEEDQEEEDGREAFDSYLAELAADMGDGTGN
jgi:hypothetical protein